VVDDDAAIPAKIPGRESRHAKRRRVREHLLDLLEALRVGEPIPPERALAQDLGVSRPTLRSVVDELVREGLLERRHGSGVYLSRPKVAQHLPGGVDGAWTSRILEFEPAHPAGARIGRRLNRSPADPVVRIMRLRMVDGEPVCIEQLYVPADLVPGLSAQMLAGGSFYRMLVQNFGIEPVRASQSIKPTVVDAEEAALLNVAAHTPALLFERVSRAGDGRIVEFCRSIYRGDRYRLQSELTLSAHAAGLRVIDSSWSAEAEGKSTEQLSLNPYDAA
jgi:GntR family transcriptional regulator